MRLIDLDVALKEIDDYKAMQTVSHYLSVAECKAARYGMDLAMTILRNCPTIDAVPVVRGEWNPIFKGADTCKCSVCKRDGVSDSDYGFIAMPYCPNCGAKMEDKP